MLKFDPSNFLLGIGFLCFIRTSEFQRRLLCDYFSKLFFQEIAFWVAFFFCCPAPHPRRWYIVFQTNSVATDLYIRIDCRNSVTVTLNIFVFFLFLLTHTIVQNELNVVCHYICMTFLYKNQFEEKLFSMISGLSCV